MSEAADEGQQELWGYCEGLRALAASQGAFPRLRLSLHRSHSAEAVGFGFEGVVLNDGDSAAEGIGDASGALLHDVGKLVAEQKLSVRRVRVVLAGSEVDVRTPGKGDGPDGRGLGADMDADVGEVCAKGGFHLGLNIAGQRPSARLGPEIDLEGIDSGAALDRGFLLYRG